MVISYASSYAFTAPCLRTQGANSWEPVWTVRTSGYSRSDSYILLVPLHINPSKVQGNRYV